jgi:two-component system response regulator ArlR
MSPLQILLVEGDRFSQAIIGQMVANNGFELQLAKTGQQALEMLQDQVFDLVLMDVEMPDMDGFTTTEYIRNNLPCSSNLPIIMITASDQPRQAAESLLHGANSYLKKPFTEREFLAELETLLP